MKERNLRDIFDEVVRERMRQDEKWGGPKHDDQHTPEDWRGFITEHTQRAYSASENGMEEAFVRQMTRVAALAMAAIESFERNERRNLKKVKR